MNAEESSQVRLVQLTERGWPFLTIAAPYWAQAQQMVEMFIPEELCVFKKAL